MHQLSQQFYGGTCQQREVGQLPALLSSYQEQCDRKFMQLALRAARAGNPAPNPHVGAAVVRAGRLISLGEHLRAGLAHAEVVALNRAGTGARGATLYVTLEPCNHQGRTPPCVAAILRAGIRRVVIGTADPNPNVRGGGSLALQAAGIEVTWSTQHAAARTLISAWFESLQGPT